MGAGCNGEARGAARGSYDSEEGEQSKMTRFSTRDKRRLDRKKLDFVEDKKRQNKVTVDDGRDSRDKEGERRRTVDENKANLSAASRPVRETDVATLTTSIVMTFTTFIVIRTTVVASSPGS